MKRPLLAFGLFLLSVFVGRAGVGPGVAGGLSITSPLMGAGQVAPIYSRPAVTVALKPVYTPGPIYSVPTPPHIVAPLPGESSHAPVVVTVGPIVHPELGARDLLQPPDTTRNTIQPNVHPEHSLHGWLHRHHWLH